MNLKKWKDIKHKKREGCQDHRPFVEDDDGITIVIACPNCTHRIIYKPPGE